MALVYILSLIGLATLIKGANLLVEGASVLAKKLGVSSLVVGLTVVAFGTSSPELAVNILASLNGNTDIAIGNILGSNIVNILLILGLSAIFYPLVVPRGIMLKGIPFAILTMVLLAVLVGSVMFKGANMDVLSRLDGLILITFFILFLYYIYKLTKTDKEIQATMIEDSTDATSISLSRSIFMIVLGLGGLIIGGKWIVDGAVAFAQSFGVSEALIGLTIVAIGTSLPEMATAVVAVYKKSVDIAVGSIIGSNIFNILWILGISAIISPLPFSSVLAFDLKVALTATIILFLVMFVGRKTILERWQGVMFVMIYILYIIILINRG